MYRKVVVPLDGSKAAESVLSHVEVLAGGCGTEEVVLLSVTERITGYAGSAQPSYTGPLPPRDPVVKIPVSIGKMQRQAERYLNRIAKRLLAKGINVRTQVLLGNPAQEIVAYTEKNDCNLIIMASHGRSGVSRWTHSIGAYGGVADKVLRASPVPVLMVKTAPSEPST